MKNEKSCGAVIFTQEGGSIKYVIIQSKDGIYGFPKGHMEESETEKETALREIAEGTGLFVDLLDGFRTEVCYSFFREGMPIMKQVVYFLAEYINQIPVVQENELNSIHLMEYEAAIAAFQFDTSKEILCEAHNFLLKQNR